MSEPIDPDDCVFLGVNADHALYVDSGFTTDDENRDCSLDQPVLAYDRDGWTTLHRVMGIRLRDGRRLVVVGQRVPWPDGSVEARKMPGWTPTSRRPTPTCATKRPC